MRFWLHVEGHQRLAADALRASSQTARTVVVAALTVFTIAALSCARVPRGTFVDDPELKALLRPSEPVLEERLLRTGETAFYIAELQHAPRVTFREQYVEELEIRGLAFRAEASSPHTAVPRVTGYLATLVQETALRSYSIRYKSAWDGDSSNGGWLSRFSWSHPPPISVRGRTLTVRFGDGLLEPWKTAILVPEQDLAAPPFRVPLPPTATILAVREEHTTGVSEGLSQTNPLPRSISVDFVARVPPAVVVEFYRDALSPWGSVSSGASELFVRFASTPPWAPPEADRFALSTEPWLFTAKEGVHVAIASKARFRAPGETGGQYQPKSLPNLPGDVYRYWATFGLEKEGAR